MNFNVTSNMNLRPTTYRTSNTRVFNNYNRSNGNTLGRLHYNTYNTQGRYVSFANTETFTASGIKDNDSGFKKFLKGMFSAFIPQSLMNYVFPQSSQNVGNNQSADSAQQSSSNVEQTPEETPEEKAKKEHDDIAKSITGQFKDYNVNWDAESSEYVAVPRSSSMSMLRASSRQEMENLILQDRNKAQKEEEAKKQQAAQQDPQNSNDPTDDSSNVGN